MKNKHENMDIIRKIHNLLKDRDVINYGKYCIRNCKFPQIDSLNNIYPIKEKMDYDRDRDAHSNIIYNRIGAGKNYVQIEKSVMFGGEQWEIYLAGTKKKINPFSIDWDEKFNDLEDEYGLHRFLWLYRRAVEASTIGFCDTDMDDVKRLIYSWIDRYDNGKAVDVRETVWHTYTVVERIVSWIFVLCLVCQDDVEDSKITSSIYRQIKMITDNLEYRGEKYTGNHLTNDGRGLYIAGMALGLPYYTELGRKIIIHEYNRVIVDGCFLREGSVHYQFLYTKWFCDLLMFAKGFDDIAFTKMLADRLKNLSDACRMFLYKNGDGNWKIPLIGDVSPDFTPEWLIGIPWMAVKILYGNIYADIPYNIGVHSLINKDKEPEFPIGNLVSKPSVIPASDWASLKSYGFKVFCHVNHSLYPNNAPGHFHHDSGSLFVVYKGVELLIDAGRCNYTLGSISGRQRSYMGHNVIAVDKTNPELEMRRFYDDAFLNYYAGVKPQVKKSENSIEATIYYGRRVKGVKGTKRKVLVKKSEIIITDYIAGKGWHKVEIIYHLPSFWDIKCKDSRIELCCDQLYCKLFFDKAIENLKVNSSETDDYSNISERYGALTRCNTVVVSQKVNLPFKLKSTIKIAER